MTRVIRGTRRALVLAGLATAATVALTACGAGQDAQTSRKVASVPGYSDTREIPDGGGATVGIRNALVRYEGSEAYAKGSTAPLEMYLFNESSSAVEVTITSPDADSVTLSGAASPQPTQAATGPIASPTAPTGTASPSPTVTPAVTVAPSPTGRPARISIPAGGYAVLSAQAGNFVQLNGLKEDLPPGSSVRLTVAFSNGVTFTEVPVPVGLPQSPLPRMPIEGVEPEHE